jgi:hypothetical protein
LRGRAAQRLPEDADHRTPWEYGIRGEELERDIVLRSAANVRALGLME